MGWANEKGTVYKECLINGVDWGILGEYKKLLLGGTVIEIAVDAGIHCGGICCNGWYTGRVGVIGGGSREAYICG